MAAAGTRLLISRTLRLMYYSYLCITIFVGFIIIYFTDTQYHKTMAEAYFDLTEHMLMIDSARQELEQENQVLGSGSTGGDTGEDGFCED